MFHSTDIYRALVGLYPASFRTRYGPDLVQNFADLLARNGRARTWRRVVLDLTLTVPRYRLETVMNPRNSTASLYVIIGALAVAGVLSILSGLYPGALLFVVAVAVGIAERSKLALATRAPDPNRRRRLLIASALLLVLCVGSTTAFLIELNNNEHWGGLKLAFYNAVFFSTAIAALICLIVGLRTPSRPRLVLGS